MPKRATTVLLSEQEQAAFVQVTKRHRSEQQPVLRARIVLAAAQGRSNVQIVRDLANHVDRVRLWRDRWAGLAGIDQETLSVAGRLQDAPRPGSPSKITAEQHCQMAAIACEAPLSAGCPISQWTGREIADELKARGASNREISEALYIASGTIRNHLSNILGKLGVRDLTQQALKAIEPGLL